MATLLTMNSIISVVAIVLVVGSWLTVAPALRRRSRAGRLPEHAAEVFIGGTVSALVLVAGALQGKASVVVVVLLSVMVGGIATATAIATKKALDDRRR